MTGGAECSCGETTGEHHGGVLYSSFDPALRATGAKYMRV